MSTTDDQLDAAAVELIPWLEKASQLEHLEDPRLCWWRTCGSVGAYINRYTYKLRPKDEHNTTTQAIVCEQHAAAETLAYVDDHLTLATRPVVQLQTWRLP